MLRKRLLKRGCQVLVEEQFWTRGAAVQEPQTLQSCFAPNAGLNTYTGEIRRGQIVHNAYLDEDTTITTRLYAGYHRRDRYQLNTYDAAPSELPALIRYSIPLRRA